MIQRDIILRWTKELAKVISKLMGKETREALGILEEATLSLLKIDVEKLENFPKEDIIAFLTEEEGLLVPQLEFLAELLLKKGELLLNSGDINLSRSILEKALLIFEYNEPQMEVFSLERHQKIEWLRQQLR